MTDQEILDALDYDVCGCGAEATYRMHTVCPCCDHEDQLLACQRHALDATRAVWMCKHCRLVCHFTDAFTARDQIGAVS